MTRNGIEYELEKSPYIYNYDDGEYNVNFYFSSQYNLNRYENNYTDFVYNELLKFKNKYKINPFNKQYKILHVTFMIAYYMKIEKRGFYITYINELGEQSEVNKYDDIVWWCLNEREISRATVIEMD